MNLAPPPSPSIQPAVGQSEEGLASWYGNPYHGRQAADGEIYDMETMVAAHRTLPFQTWVRVYNLDNRKTVDVRIIDRGPFVDGRIIDLSRAAARQIDMLGPGTARVRVVVTQPPGAPVIAGRFAVQVGAFRDRSNAERLRGEMAARYGAARVLPQPGNAALWRVVVGDEASSLAAEALAVRIRGEAAVPPSQLQPAAQPASEASADAQAGLQASAQPEPETPAQPGAQPPAQPSYEPPAQPLSQPYAQSGSQPTAQSGFQTPAAQPGPQPPAHPGSQTPVAQRGSRTAQPGSRTPLSGGFPTAFVVRL